MKPRILVIVGPTCSGKSALAVEAALRFDGEVVSADSRQVYRGLDIGTGKITREEMRGVPHHLLDVADPCSTLSVEQYQELAYAAIEATLSRAKLPIVAGGSGMYIQSIVDGIVLPPVPPNPSLRADLAKMPLEELWKTLRREDPERAETIDRKNPRRLQRAIEIAYAIGPVSALEKKPRYSPLQISLELPTEILHEKIHRRLLERIEAGMAEEARRLHDEGLSYERMDTLGLEYRYLAKLLRGEMDEKTFAIELEKAIRRYAKRQITWFKRDMRIAWFDPRNTLGVFEYLENALYGS